MDGDKFTLAKRLRKQLLTDIEKSMAEEDMSQGEVARRIGSLRHNVNQVLAGKKGATFDHLLKMAEGIGLDVEMKVRKKKG